MPAGPPPWTLATSTTIHTASAVRDLGLVGALSLAAGSVVKFGHDRVAANTSAEDSLTRTSTRDHEPSCGIVHRPVADQRMFAGRSVPDAHNRGS